MSAQAIGIQWCLVFAGICLGIVLGVRDARKKRGDWREYPQRYDIMKDCKR
jgi:hypothetical protein